ncbi:LysM peptidoglycan-binding domain-containing protein [Marinigracilibium pacificum]|uniref:LysM peptidoglycan-binding domain-containing protein n=1 Tax=Marinigracilibium pacificum TaxID=2729599 RepID=A0A848IW69_9BACT|nr:LysM domain-containing protein [Marinigracilibium pacificum]NMM47408.1 LysM peptidoglycan-binding domain-containing protein [Marinigracilibium pacificum]
MELKQKYKSVIDIAEGTVQDLSIEENGNVLKITGKAQEEDKQRMWDAYKSIDPDMRAGDFILNVEATDFDEVYEIQPGDSLSKIGKKYGVSWQEIYEMNKDTIKDPDVIFPGQKIKIPK